LRYDDISIYERILDIYVKNFTRRKQLFMLRILQEGNSLPFSFIVDPNAEFQPGMIAQLNVMGNQIVCGVSDGTAPIGIIDDIKCTAFTAASVDEVIQVPAQGIVKNGILVTVSDIKTELENSNILPNSFLASIDVELIPRNGVIVIPAGTPLNVDLTGSGQPDGVRVVVNYTYQVPNVPGDDSTQGSHRVTVWFQRIMFETNQYETNVRYPLNCPLFVSEAGYLTSRQPTPNHAAIAICIAPPAAISGTLQAILL
jgi:hypothetical protein